MDNHEKLATHDAQDAE